MGPRADTDAGSAEPAATGEDDSGRPRLFSGVDISHPLIQDIFLDPRKWLIWPTVAALRWLMRKADKRARGVVYRSKPSLRFSPSEVADVVIASGGIELILEAPGLAGPGSLLPTADIARIVDNQRRHGGLAEWLDWPVDRFMQAAEESKSLHHAAFGLATGGRLEAMAGVATLTGRSAPLAVLGAGRLADTWRREPEGAVGLAALFLGPSSASGLSALYRAFTGLPAEVAEFTGGMVDILRPARVGGGFGSMLGTRCDLAVAGVKVVIVGGDDPGTWVWAREPERRASLHLLARTYIGSPLPRANIVLRLDAGNAPPAALGVAAFGGLAVLGRAEAAVELPLAA